MPSIPAKICLCVCVFVRFVGVYVCVLNLFVCVLDLFVCVLHLFVCVLDLFATCFCPKGHSACNSCTG
jgi:hypothetical protein